MTQLELEFRAASGLDVSFPRRQIDVVVMPYETEAEVEYRGRLIREIVSRGAFEGIDAKHRRIAVNRGHDVDKVIGKAVRFHPSREEGLVAELQIAKTAAGDETLQLAADGLLDASAGFGVPAGGQTWVHNTFRRLNRVWLDHIAMVPDPAYTGTEVLAVRAVTAADALEAAGGTPNLDTLRGWRLADRGALIGLTAKN